MNREIQRVGRGAYVIGLIVGLALALPVWGQSNTAGEQGPSFDRGSSVVEPIAPQKRAEIEKLIASELQRSLDGLERLPGQAKHISVRVKMQYDYDPHRPTIVIYLGRGFIPQGAQTFGAQLEDMTSHLATIAEELVRDVIQVYGVLFRFDGRPREYYFPELLELSINDDSGVVDIAARRPKVVVSAGHGYYYHYGFNAWTAQRDPYNGVTEDFITQDHASTLGDLFLARSNAQVYFARSFSTEIHESSGQEWWKVSARYFLESEYPRRNEIWNSLPSATHALRERDEDIRSRPLFANYVRGDKLVSIHTDGNDNPAVRGARAYFHAGRAVDQAIADSALCSMKEILEASEYYADYPVAAAATVRDNLAENSLAAMPAVIVEVGFHTNPEDALALQDAAFREAAMKGIEKGVRVHAKGNGASGCEFFGITSVPDVIGQTYIRVPVIINFNGYPQFPVKLNIEPVDCPSGTTCVPLEEFVTEEAESPLETGFTCGGGFIWGPATTPWKVTLKDADDVEPDPYVFNVTCPQSGPWGMVGSQSNQLDDAAYWSN